MHTEHMPGQCGALRPPLHPFPCCLPPPDPHLVECLPSHQYSFAEQRGLPSYGCCCHLRCRHRCRRCCHHCQGQTARGHCCPSEVSLKWRARPQTCPSPPRCRTHFQLWVQMRGDVCGCMCVHAHAGFMHTQGWIPIILNFSVGLFYLLFRGPCGSAPPLQANCGL